MSYIAFQRKQFEDFKEQVRVRKEKRMLKDTSMETENWGRVVEDVDKGPQTPLMDFYLSLIIIYFSMGGEKKKSLHLNVNIVEF